MDGETADMLFLEASVIMEEYLWLVGACYL